MTTPWTTEYVLDDGHVTSCCQSDRYVCRRYESDGRTEEDWHCAECGGTDWDEVDLEDEEDQGQFGVGA